MTHVFKMMCHDAYVMTGCWCGNVTSRVSEKREGDKIPFLLANGMLNISIGSNNFVLPDRVMNSPFKQNKTPRL